MLVAGLLLAAPAMRAQPGAAGAGHEAKIMKWVRFQAGGRVAYGLAEGDRIRQVTGDPFIVSGLNYDDLQLETRVNGQVRQRERTSEMAQKVAALVSHASQYVTLEPGDLIFTGTPGQTSALKPGDVVEVELEGVGVLRNEVVRVR